MMFSMLPKILTGVAVAAVLASVVLGGLVLKYRGDWVEAELLNAQLRTSLEEERRNAKIVDELNIKREAERATSGRESREVVNVIVEEKDDGCLDRAVPDAIVNRMFPEPS